jgi:hypothetical protein
MNYPEYTKINDRYKTAILLDSLAPELVSKAINTIMQDEALLTELRLNCLKAREVYCWQNEEKRLIEFYQNLYDNE